MLRSLTLALLLAAPAHAQDKPDLLAVHRIKSEAFRNSKVMDTLFWLTDANGPRVTNSPGYTAAATWAVRTLSGWGASSARLEKWGTFGRGWELKRSSVRLVTPVAVELPAVPLAWSGGTTGPVKGEPVLAPVYTARDKDLSHDLARLRAHHDAYMKANAGRFKGKIVLVTEPRKLGLPTAPAGVRLDDGKLAERAQAVEPAAVPPVQWPLTTLPEDAAERAALLSSWPLEILAERWDALRAETARLEAFFRAEGALAVLSGDGRGEGGLIFAEAVHAWQLNAPPSAPMLVLAPEAYNRLCRLVEKKVPTTVQVDLEVAFDDSTADSFNVVAELPGGKKKDEVVMLGAHLDSWHAGTGATDNAVGVAVVMEAFRIIKASGLPVDRTVRLALWSGEEQALYGSRGYVKAHFADPVTMKTRPEHEKLAGYFNLDNGSGKIRGVYLQGNDMARPFFEAALAPFRDMGVSTISSRTTGGTDHLAFDEVGLPGFQFIQDPLDYMSRTHHSDLDVADHALPADLMQASAVMASVVYMAATRPDRLPRKPLPPPLPPRTAR